MHASRLYDTILVPTYILLMREVKCFIISYTPVTLQLGVAVVKKVQQEGLVEGLETI